MIYTPLLLILKVRDRKQSPTQDIYQLTDSIAYPQRDFLLSFTDLKLFLATSS
jgi:hypothetical protein